MATAESVCDAQLLAKPAWTWPDEEHGVEWIKCKSNQWQSEVICAHSARVFPNGEALRCLGRSPWLSGPLPATAGGGPPCGGAAVVDVSVTWPLHGRYITVT